MARLEVRWADRALDELNAIGEYIALDNPEAAKRVVKRVFESADRLEAFPRSGKKIPECPSLPHRELVVPPCRVFYRLNGAVLWIVHVIRSERILRKSDLVD